MLEGLEDLWDENQYSEEFSLQSFTKKPVNQEVRCSNTNGAVFKSVRCSSNEQGMWIKGDCWHQQTLCASHSAWCSF